MTIEAATRLLYEAAHQRKVCQLQFKGEPEARTIHPYGICKTTNNRIIIVCLQTDGYSESKKLPSYKNLPLKNCEDVEVLDMRFIMQNNFDPDDPLYKEWVFHI
jgi:hypothetical protein